MLSGGLLLAALGTALAMLHRNIRSILEPLEEARAALEALARGDYDRPVRIRRIDEVGDVLIAIDDLSQYLAVMLPAEDVAPEPEPVSRPTVPARPIAVHAVPDFDHIVEQMLDDDGNGPFIVDGGTTAIRRTEPSPARVVDQV
jgi:HAMP domain-containing protein